MTQDWVLTHMSPGVVASDSLDDSLPLPANEAQTYTHPKDFARVYRMTQTGSLEYGFLSIRSCEGKNILPPDYKPPPQR